MKRTLVLIAAALALAGCKSSTSASGPAPAASGSASASAAAHHAVTIARFHGSGIQSTARFRVGGSGDWRLKWSYNCASFGAQGNFQVDEDKRGADFSGASVNELGRRGHGTTHVYSDKGAHFLEVNSECSWKMRVVGTR